MLFILGGEGGTSAIYGGEVGNTKWGGGGFGAANSNVTHDSKG